MSVLKTLSFKIVPLHLQEEFFSDLPGNCLQDFYQRCHLSMNSYFVLGYQLIIVFNKETALQIVTYISLIRLVLLFSDFPL